MKQVRTSNLSFYARTRQTEPACTVFNCLSVEVGGGSFISKSGSLIKDFILSAIKSGQQPEQERVCVCVCPCVAVRDAE